MNASVFSKALSGLLPHSEKYVGSDWNQMNNPTNALNASAHKQAVNEVSLDITNKLQLGGKKKSAAKKPVAKKTVVKKAPAKKPMVKKAPAKKPAAKKTVVKKAPAKKSVKK